MKWQEHWVRSQKAWGSGPWPGTHWGPSGSSLPFLVSVCTFQANGRNKDGSFVESRIWSPHSFWGTSTYGHSACHHPGAHRKRQFRQPAPFIPVCSSKHFNNAGSVYCSKAPFSLQLIRTVTAGWCSQGSHCSLPRGISTHVLSSSCQRPDFSYLDKVCLLEHPIYSANTWFKEMSQIEYMHTARYGARTWSFHVTLPKSPCTHQPILCSLGKHPLRFLSRHDWLNL